MKVIQPVKETLSLSTLQNLLKRDPISYRQDFIQYYDEYNQRFKDFQFSSSKYDEELERLVMFLAQVIHCYPECLSVYTETVVNTLKEKSMSMDPTMRMTFVKATILLKNKGLLQGSAVIELFFRLFKCQDKLLRKTLRIFIAHDIKKANKTHKNNKLNSKLQNFLSLRISDSNPATAKEAVLITTNLYRKNIWRDARTVNILANACFSKNTKVLVTALQFFLDTSNPTLEDSDDESDSEQLKSRKIQQAKLSHRVGRKTRKRERKLERALHNIKQSHKKNSLNENVANFSAIHLLHDPQNFVERLFKSVEHCRERFEVKLMLLDLISRMIGVHQLLLINFYPLLQRYLTPHQKDVTHLLLYAAQASHDQVPPDIMESICRTIADNFITERASSEAIAVGLNSIREIASRCAYAVGEDLLSDLIEYRSYRDKNVVAAARSLIRLYRLINPLLLPKSERGRPTEAQNEQDVSEGVGVLPATSYGAVNAPSFIPGAEILPNQDRDEEKVDKKSSTNEEEWNSCSDDSEDDEEDEWIDVAHSSDENEDELTKLEKLTKEDKMKKAELLSSTKIFSQDDFNKIKQYQCAKENRAVRSNKRKRHDDREEVIDIPDSEDDDGRGGELVSLSSIERLVKRSKQDKNERLESVKEGREDRGKYGFKVNRQNPNASTTNREKRKMKPFQMVKHKARKKANRSFREKQINLRDRLKKMAKFMRS